MSKDDVQTEDIEETSASEESLDPLEDLENEEISFEDEDDSDEAQEETVEEQEESEDESSEDTEESEEGEDTAPVEQKESEDESEDEPAQESKDESDDKSEVAQEAFKRREAERRLREAEQQREVENLQRYLNEAKEDENEFAKREREVNNYVLTKQRAELFQRSLDVDMRRAVADLGLSNMDEATRSFVNRRLDDFETSRVVKDQQGNILDIRGDVYQYLKDELDSIAAFKSSGAREQTKKKTAEKSRTVVKPTRAPKEKPKDADVEAFDEEFYD